jgi:phospholipase C
LRLSRRKLLTGATALGGFTAASFALPSNLGKAMAATSPRSFSSKEVKHVVLMMMENRSFDHYFGTFPGVRGFSDPAAITLSTGKSVFYQPDPKNPDGYLLP